MRPRQIFLLVAASGLVLCACSGSGGDGSTFLVPCDDPAPLSGMPSPPSLGFVIVLRVDAVAATEAPRIAAACGFDPGGVRLGIQTFATPLDIVELGCVRCDPVVTRVAPDAILFPAMQGIPSTSGRE